jgi:DNA-binding cell septation regulator SpoVG
VKPNNGLVAFVSCILDNKWHVGNIAVYTRLGGGYRLVYPTKKIKEENFNIFHPIRKDVGDKVEQEVTKKCEEIWKLNNNQSNL